MLPFGKFHFQCRKDIVATQPFPRKLASDSILPISVARSSSKYLDCLHEEVGGFSDSTPPACVVAQFIVAMVSAVCNNITI